MAYYREYRGFEVHLEDKADVASDVVWIVRGYGPLVKASAITDALAGSVRERSLIAMVKG